MEKTLDMTQKQKYILEFEIKSSPRILFNYIATASGLEEWFADRVNIRDGVFIFRWDGSEAKAKLVSKKDNSFVKFKWVDNDSEEYFQFEIVQDALTSDVALLITDFSTEDDMEENKLLWETQVHKLMHILGC